MEKERDDKHCNESHEPSQIQHAPRLVYIVSFDLLNYPLYHHLTIDKAETTKTTMEHIRNPNPLKFTDQEPLDSLQTKSHTDHTTWRRLFGRWLTEAAKYQQVCL